MKCAWIKIDTRRLTLRLWRTHGRFFDLFELRQWLKNSGCDWVGGQWFACAGELCHLEAEEILQVQQRVTEGGITFVDNQPPNTNNPESS
ncbi:MAG TPA: hypothetical protein VK797_27730 [Tepidisphaeraceae bacterium]|jgi:hypothetical protein|nr:hypothetical protein [Tepidisphaeraceae bacterium]